MVTIITPQKKSSDNTKTMNRWIVVIGAIMIQVALGAIYAWSAFTGPMQSPDAYNFSKTFTQAIFSTGLATFGVFTIIGGRLQKKYGPMKIAMLGGILLGLGYLIGGFSGDNFPLKLIGIGLIGGAGIGLGYVVPIGVGIKWFPDKKGLVSGLAVAGFGFGAFLWILMANPPSILGITGLIDTTTYNIANVDMAFRIYGILFFILVFLGSLVMKYPPEGWKPKGWNPPQEKDKSGKSTITSYFPKQMLKKKQFYFLWTMFFIGALAGLMVIGNIQNFAKDTGDGVPDWYEINILNTDQTVEDVSIAQREEYIEYKRQIDEGTFETSNWIYTYMPTAEDWKNTIHSDSEGFGGFGYDEETTADFAVIGAAMCLPLFNGLGRIVWGKISDNITRKKAFIAMFLFQGIMMAIFLFSTGNPIFFYISAALIGFNFGGNFALFPSATADTFGADNVGLNYGYVFTSYAIGGIVGPTFLAGIVQDLQLSFSYAFYPAAIMCFIAVIIGFMYTPKIKE